MPVHVRINVLIFFLLGLAGKYGAMALSNTIGCAFCTFAASDFGARFPPLRYGAPESVGYAR